MTIILLILILLINVYYFLILKTIVMNQTELAAKLSSIGDQLFKAIAEIKAAVGNTTPEVDAALQKVSDVAQQLDDLNPDA